MNNNGKRNILLVEDDAIVAMSQSIKLKEYGYNILHVLKGKKAIEAINDSNSMIDLILMDINLGEAQDGTEIAKIILKDHDIPLLFLSNHSEREVVSKTENITFYGYVVKNSGITVLDASIKMAFRLHEAYKNLKNQKKELETKKKELQIYEKRYRRLFESAQDGILILNADTGTIVDVNPFLIKMLGYSKEQFLKKNIWDISTFSNINYSKQLFKELQEKEYVRYENLPLETSDGKLIHVEFVSNVYLVDNERVIQCNIRDITQRWRLEKIISDNLDKKESLLKEMQHRIKNSFGLIMSFINLRSSVSHSEETINTLEELSSRVNSISDLYSLLFESDTFYEIQLNAYCDKVADSILRLSKNISLIKNLEEISIPSSSAATIGMILVELLSNSIKYAFPNHNAGIINIDLKRVNSHISMSVEDNGIGLEKNFNIKNIESLGLNLVNLMVSQLDGNIKFISGNGTKIVMEFPYKN